jgi:hypothetical protein
VWWPVPRTVPVDDAGEGRFSFATLPPMSIEMQAGEVYRLADTLRGAAGVAEDIAVHLRGVRSVGGGLQAAVDTFLESHRAASQAFTGELAWLAGTVTDVADSWLRLDRELLGRPGGVVAE